MPAGTWTPCDVSQIHAILSLTSMAKDQHQLYIRFMEREGCFSSALQLRPPDNLCSLLLTLPRASLMTSSSCKPCSSASGRISPCRSLRP